jgi:Flp pilus assembly protein protease CpaA
LPKLVFAAATVGISDLAVILLRGWFSALVISAMLIITFVEGPKIFGRDWLYDGFIAGSLLGGSLGFAMGRDETS